MKQEIVIHDYDLLYFKQASAQLKTTAKAISKNKTPHWLYHRPWKISTDHQSLDHC